MVKYVLFIPQGGLNDCLVQIRKTIDYCRNHNRVLLLDMMTSVYNINFNDYFDIPYPNVIYDSNMIRTLIINNKFTVYPNCLSNYLIDIIDCKILFKYVEGYLVFAYDDVFLSLPHQNVVEDIIIHSSCGGGNGFKLFEQILLKDNIKDYCKEKIALLKDNNYLCIHIRNTDITCNYHQLYQDYKELIHSYDKIYITTDDEKSLDFFRSQNLQIFNFNIFPQEKCHNLHYSKIDPNDKIKSLLCDIFIAINSIKFISYSSGGFTRLLSQCFSQKNNILKKLN